MWAHLFSGYHHYVVNTHGTAHCRSSCAQTLWPPFPADKSRSWDRTPLSSAKFSVSPERRLFPKLRAETIPLVDTQLGCSIHSGALRFEWAHDAADEFRKPSQRPWPGLL